MAAEKSTFLALVCGDDELAVPSLSVCLAAGLGAGGTRSTRLRRATPWQELRR